MILIGTSADLAYAPPASPCDVVDLSIREVVKDRPGPRTPDYCHLATVIGGRNAVSAIMKFPRLEGLAIR
jgi:hypothetical protein